ncbi:hypothetical protein FKM82_021785 [Ascaphus truei]
MYFWSVSCSPALWRVEKILPMFRGVLEQHCMFNPYPYLNSNEYNETGPIFPLQLPVQGVEGDGVARAQQMPLISCAGKE